MIEPEVMLPALSEDESPVLEHVLESSKELVPSVQVTLAKRILRPGSNKVMCMAAQTSVPLNDDEKASVSDMALRLSDGTNVKLSLSFFNEGDSHDLVQPLKRLNYVPEHYAATQTDPNFGQVIAATCMIAVTCFYYMAKSPSGLQANPFSFPKASVSAHHASVLSITPQAAKPAALAKQGAPTKPTIKPALRSGSDQLTTVKPSVKARTTGNGLSHGRAERAARISNSRNDAFFVPPPPPTTYTYPVRPMPFMPYMIEPQVNAGNPVEPSRPAAPKAKAEHIVSTPASKAAPVLDNTRDSSEWLPTPAPSVTQKYENRQPPSQASTRKSIEAGAPSPGSEKDYPQLERIVLPSSN